MAQAPRDRHPHASRTFLPASLPAARVKNTWAWALALLPVVWVIFDVATADASEGTTFSMVMVIGIAQIVLIVGDAYTVEASGHKSPWPWFWFLPVYLYKRASIVGQSKAHFCTNVVGYVFSLMVFTAWTRLPRRSRHATHLRCAR
jgi:hypothetical protein